MDVAGRIDELWESGELDPGPIEEAVGLLDRGEARVAEKRDGEWVVNEWTKKAILLYFRLRKVAPMDVGGLHFLDKIPVKSDYAERGVRVVPPGVARFGSFLAEGVVLMPGYVNIGAWVGPRTMVDTWATVGSCAQIGADVHLAANSGRLDARVARGSGHYRGMPFDSLAGTWALANGTGRLGALSSNFWTMSPVRRW